MKTLSKILFAAALLVGASGSVAPASASADALTLLSARFGGTQTVVDFGSPESRVFVRQASSVQDAWTGRVNTASRSVGSAHGKFNSAATVFDIENASLVVTPTLNIQDAWTGHASTVK